MYYPILDQLPKVYMEIVQEEFGRWMEATIVKDQLEDAAVEH